jgi:protein-tyrosine phosphatase
MQKALNFRDSGNYPTTNGRLTKAGFLYRSGELDRASAKDIKQIRSLGIKTIIDLRPLAEHRKGFSGITGTQGILIPLDFDRLTRERLKPFLYKRNSSLNIEDAIDSVYSDMVDQSLPQLEKLFRILLSREFYPIVINCRGGKDRTGFIIAIIQLALGVCPEFIIQDYLKTNEMLVHKVNRAVTLAKWLSIGIFPAQHLRTIFTARERYINTVMDKIATKYGGINGYLQKAGLQEPELELLRNILLTEAQSLFPKIC